MFTLFQIKISIDILFESITRIRFCCRRTIAHSHVRHGPVAGHVVRSGYKMATHDKSVKHRSPLADTNTHLTPTGNVRKIDIRSQKYEIYNSHRIPVVYVMGRMIKRVSIELRVCKGSVLGCNKKKKRNKLDEDSFMFLIVALIQNVQGFLNTI